MKRLLLTCLVLLATFSGAYAAHVVEPIIQPHDQALHDQTIAQHHQEESAKDSLYHPPIDPQEVEHAFVPGVDQLIPTDNFYQDPLLPSVTSPATSVEMFVNDPSSVAVTTTVNPLPEEPFVASQIATPSEAAALKAAAEKIPVRNGDLTVLAQAAADVADALPADLQENVPDQASPVYQQAISLIGDAWVRQPELQIDGGKLIDISARLRQANALPEPERSEQLKRLVDELKVLTQSAEILQRAQDDAITQKARLVSEPLADVVQSILQQQRDIWGMAIASVHRSEIAIQVFIEHQQDIIEILKSTEDRDIVLAKLRSLNEQLQIVIEAFVAADKIEDREPVVDLVTLNLLKERFGDAVYARALQMNEYFENLPYQFTENFLRLYVRKQLKKTFTKDDLRSNDVLDVFDVLDEQIKKEQAARLSQLYAVRISAMSFAVRMNYMRIIQQALLFANANDFTQEQKRLLEAIKQDIMDQNSAKLNTDLQKLGGSVSLTGLHPIIYGTAEQRATLHDHLILLRDALVFADAQDQIKKADLFDALYNELYSLGAAADPFLVGLIISPDRFGVVLEKRFLDILDIVLGEYEFEVQNGDKTPDSIASLRDTVTKFKELLEPKIANIEEQFVQDNHPFTESMEKAAGVEADLIKAHELTVLVQNYVEQQADLMVHFATLRSQAVSLLKSVVPSQAVVADFSSAVDRLHEQITAAEKNNDANAQNIEDLKALNKGVMQSLSDRLVLLQGLAQTQSVQEEVAAVQRKMQETQQELQQLETYDVEKLSFNNDQMVEYYGQIALLLSGEPFDLLYGVKDGSLFNKSDAQVAYQRRTFETVVLLEAAKEDEDIDQCLKAFAQANEISRNLNNLNLLIAQLLAKVMDIVGRIERAKSNINYSDSDAHGSDLLLAPLEDDLEAYQQQFVDVNSSLESLKKKCDDKMCSFVKKIVNQLVKLAQNMQEELTDAAEHLKSLEFLPAQGS